MIDALNRCGDWITVGNTYQYGSTLFYSKNKCEILNMGHLVMSNKVVEYPLDFVTVTKIEPGKEEAFVATIQFDSGYSKTISIDHLKPVDAYASNLFQESQKYTCQIES